MLGVQVPDTVGSSSYSGRSRALAQGMPCIVDVHVLASVLRLLSASASVLRQRPSSAQQASGHTAGHGSSGKDAAATLNNICQKGVQLHAAAAAACASDARCMIELCRLQIRCQQMDSALQTVAALRARNATVAPAIMNEVHCPHCTRHVCILVWCAAAIAMLMLLMLSNKLQILEAHIHNARSSRADVAKTLQMMKDMSVQPGTFLFSVSAFACSSTALRHDTSTTSLCIMTSFCRFTYCYRSGSILLDAGRAASPRH
jgi:hypothetical protein